MNKPVRQPNKKEYSRHSSIVFAKRFAKQKPFGAICFLIILALFFIALFAPQIAPYGMNETRVGPFSSPPSLQFILGTDNLGRDLLSRIIYGARTSVIVGLVATTIATFLSTLLGVLSGYYGKFFDLALQRVVDAWMCFPGVILLMVLISIFGAGMWQLIFVLGISWGIIGSRIIRSATLTIRNNTYIQAARAVGCKTGRILSRYVLPNLIPQIIILFTTRIPAIILAEASLSFLGYGVPPPTPSWGGMLSSSRDFIFQAPWMAIWPGLALSIVVFCVNMFGDALNDMLDPKLKGGIGRFNIRKAKEKKEKLNISKNQSKSEYLAQKGE